MTGAVTIIGGGLAGCEAAWQIAGRGVRVVLREMKPQRYSPAHHLSGLAELVCSNSLRGESLENAVGLLKEELRRAGSLIMAAADATRVPAGGALAVDRELFSSYVTERIEGHPLIELVREEVTELPAEGVLVIASGPLTSDALAERLKQITGDSLYFYDAIAPIVAADSLDSDKVFRASRYGKGDGDDYLNCPLSEEEYERFVDAVLAAEKVPARDFEKVVHFEGCMPVEEMAERGRETLRFGPLKPVGLTDPRTGREPHAVVQLRAENREGTLFNLVGFQTKLTWPEQRRVFRMIPGLESAEFVRLGSMHRNTFINAPTLLEPTFRLKGDPRTFFAGQITGVEGYVESAGSGFLAGINSARLVRGEDPAVPPPVTALGALVAHITTAPARHFQPMNVNYGLFPPLEGKVKKKDRRGRLAERALAELDHWLATV
ncbi:methylenetetrahydrofolate--tRNA-(uracil(54)-C(5))-methyltransferase (FADH(2)-oxidizing) TrmFO [Geobacter sulfurreducens]|uniref:Methylenetetrahydrofolate--tRNA-(uracil-5-)-methyltransferase TrmFO n=1 Tax=Geobacter sulfurreducens (strain ATCC 51573 / DSM 12127 / PCA) TaxID=243231 RepID=TRMFO_GEOSL|nr:methylenetetrahydrofolate--tRNA-(uracil(54)-C(5))-methyltransferase (FADH(2)-oxidizing) TrmFO [Geobacter sulfurreducens]Q74A44.1 RecName: Full=Methylenetetrahydrofolate--tRNA-(uracil-5-)-methyltransferase TrmFO; AltName: Full=Folate-dependent tRNA (uracil-5-)-methyltransferase; AltName: Full=Folate-dependent tRNA(M-5-U54)-methyltransferase [Geobacter sulfurreducens PCA]AAR35920.1 tRNA (5-methyl-U54)-methylenetransferase/reductase [Geobacter sulfurreducens PCA]ADI85305.1 tRNA (5-methyl-U54)-me